MSKLYIIGAGNHAKQIIDIFRSRKMKIFGIFDDNKKKKDQLFYHQYEVLDTIKNAKNYLNDDSLLFCSIGDNELRRKICEEFREFRFADCISLSVKISETAKIIGSGNYIGNGVVVGPDVVIDSHNILNENSVIAHDSCIGCFNHVAPTTCICGGVTMGDNNLIGANTTIIPGINIGDGNVIGAGSVIVKDIGSDTKVIQKV